MRWPVWSLSIALIGSAATSWWLWQELRAEQARNADIKAMITRESMAISSPAMARVPSPRRVPATTPASSATPVTHASSVEPPQRVSLDPEDYRAKQQRLLGDPNYVAAFRAQSRLSLMPRRANLIRLIGLTPEAADAVIEATVDHQMLSRDRQPFQVESEEQREKWRAQVAAEDAAAEARIRSLVGEQKYPRYEEYMESRQSRMQVDRLRGNLTESEALRDDQVEPLIAALHAAAVQSRQEQQDFRQTINARSDEGEIDRIHEFQARQLKLDRERMRAAAGSILTNAQLAGLDDMFSVDKQRHEANLAMQRVQLKLELQGAKPD
jgi:hypothetical protein